MIIIVDYDGEWKLWWNIGGDDDDYGGFSGGGDEDDDGDNGDYDIREWDVTAVST